MSYPPLHQKLFKNSGAGPELKEEIVPHELDSAVTLNASLTANSGVVSVGTDNQYIARQSTTGQELMFGFGASGFNRGIFDNKNQKWLIYANNESSSDVNTTGNLTVQGKTTSQGFISQDGGEETATGNSALYIKRAYVKNGAPNNGVILSFGNNTNWCGQLYMGDNSTQGCSWNGWNDGVRGTWKHLWMEGEWIKATGFTATSDARHKRDLTPVSYDLSSISAYHYTLTDDSKPHVGLVAQEVQEVIPDAVSSDKDGTLSLDYNAVVAALVEEVKDLKRRCDSLESEKVSLRAAVENLAEQKESLKKRVAAQEKANAMLASTVSALQNAIGALEAK